MVLKKYLVLMLVLGGNLGVLRGFSQSLPHMELYNGTVRITGIDSKSSLKLAQLKLNNEDLSNVIQVYTQYAYAKNLNLSVAGTCEWNSGFITFKPLFDFVQGENYYARLDYVSFISKLGFTDSVLKYSNKKKWIDFVFNIPRQATPVTFIESIHPKADTLPENLLRMYIYFSASMSTGEAYQHIHLISENGTPVENAFLIVEQELWDSKRHRFTLLFDPGRIKRGLTLNKEQGTPLKKNHSYKLVIDSLWSDSKGNSLAGKYTKKIVVRDADRSKLSTELWKIVPPQAGSKNPLVIHFDKPLDHALTLKQNSIKLFQTGVVNGKVSLSENDKLWLFTPDSPWISGNYTLEVSPDLEDVSGNNFTYPFDADISSGTRVSSAKPVQLFFKVTPL